MQNDEVLPRPEKTARTKPGVLCFSSTDDLDFAIAAMKETKNLDIRSNPITRAVVAGPVEGFVSLREHLIDQGLQSFTDTELAEITADSLDYDPEDSLIVDPYMSAILNSEREVQIGGKVCRFINDGLVMYQANDRILFDPNNMEKVKINHLSHGQSVTIMDHEGIRAEFVKIEYQSLQADWMTMTDGSSFSPDSPGNSTNNSTMSYNNDGSITLSNGVKIPRDRIRRTAYTKGGGNGSWLAKGVSGFFGSNVTSPIISTTGIA